MFGAVSRRYAKALLAIGIDSKSTDALGKELDRAAAILHDSEDLRRTLENPVFPQSMRRPILEEIAARLALSKPVTNLIKLLLERNRISIIGDVARAHRVLVDEHAGRVRAKVTTAGPIDPQLEDRLRAAFEKKTKKTVILEKQQDPSIVGGVVAQLGDMVYDGSVRNQLQAIRNKLLGDN